MTSKQAPESLPGRTWIKSRIEAFFQRRTAVKSSRLLRKRIRKIPEDGIIPLWASEIPDKYLSLWITDRMDRMKAFFHSPRSEAGSLPLTTGFPSFLFFFALLGDYLTSPEKAEGYPWKDSPEQTWHLFLEFQSILRLVQKARVGGIRIPDVRVFDFMAYPAILQELQRAVGEIPEQP